MQAALYLATKEPGTVVPADEISKELKIPREFVSKILQSLRESKLIASVKGKAGGFFLAKDPKKIKLIDIVQAIDGLGMFDNCVLGFPKCSPTAPCPLHDKWGVLRNQAYEMLNAETLAEVKSKTLNKIKNL